MLQSLKHVFQVLRHMFQALRHMFQALRHVFQALKHKMSFAVNTNSLRVTIKEIPKCPSISGFI